MMVGMACLLFGLRIEASELMHKIYLPAIARTVISAQGVGATYANCERLAGHTWFYDWSTDPPDCFGRVAMIWGRGDVGAEIDTEWVMGFNEPGMPQQANIDPIEGAILWRQIEQDYPDKRLVSPSAGLGWLTAWWAAYLDAYGQPPRVDAVGSHCCGPYNAATAIAWCEANAGHVVAWAVDRGISEVWVTEFAHLPCWIDNADSIKFMQAMVTYYRKTPTITRWAWFQNSYHGDEPWAFGPDCNTSLVDIDTGERTALGEAYRELGTFDWR